MLPTRRSIDVPQAGTGHQVALRAERGSVQGRARPAAPAGASWSARYWHDAFIQIDDFKNEGVVASGSWPFQVNLLKADGQPVASTIPEEGATGWADTTMMHVDAEHPTCSYLWMEHTLSSNLQSDLSVWFGVEPGGPRGCTDGSGQQTKKAAPRTDGRFRQEPVLDHSGVELQPGGWRLRALLPLGFGLHRRDRRPLIP